MFAGQCVEPGTAQRARFRFRLCSIPATDGVRGKLPRGTGRAARHCIGQTTVPPRRDGLQHGAMCRASGRRAQHLEHRCYDQCPQGKADLGNGTCGNCPSGQEIVNGVCLARCPTGTIREGDQCVPGCPEGQTMFAGGCVVADSCPEGELLKRRENSGYTCVSPDDCRDDDLLVQDDICVTRGACSNQGRVTYNGQCVEQCPEGAESRWHLLLRPVPGRGGGQAGRGRH